MDRSESGVNRSWQVSCAAMSVAFVLFTTSVQAQQTQTPLAPPDTSSPRATLRSFARGVDEIYQQMRTAAHTHKNQTANQRRVTFVLNCLDLSEVAPSIAHSRGREAAVALKEVLDRVDLPSEAEIPDAKAVKTDGLTRWRVPGTEITLVRISQGEREGEFLFSSETVARAVDYYQSVRDLPYKPNAGSKGLYEAYVHMGGWMIPTSWIHALPDWARSTYLNIMLWQWLSTVVLTGMAVAIVAGMFGLMRQHQKAGKHGHVLRVALPLSIIGVSLMLDYLLSYQVRLTGQVLIFIELTLRVTIFCASMVAILFVANRVSDLIIHARQLRAEAIDTQLVRLGCRVVTFVLVAWLAMMGADYLGISITPLLAGIGVSGLAVALASQHTIENLIAGIVLFADKPVRIGEVCQFGSIRGTVEQIGLRSTRIRAVDRTVISIPNAEFAKLQLVNFTRRDKILLKAVLQLRYETTADQLRFVLARLREMLVEHSRLARDSVEVRFVGYGPYSLDVELSALAMTSSTREFLSIQEDVLLLVMDIINECGTGFAFPTQTHYVAQDSGIDTARAKLAEAKVQSWRQEGILHNAGAHDGALAASTNGSGDNNGAAGAHKDGGRAPRSAA